MQESLDSLLLIIVEKLVDDRHSGQTGQRTLKEQLVVDAGEEYHKNPHHDIDQRAAQVLFEYDGDDRRRDQEGLKNAGEPGQLVTMLRQIACHDQDKGDFDEFRWLQGRDAEIDPGAGTVVFLTEPGDIYRQQEKHR